LWYDFLQILLHFMIFNNSQIFSYYVFIMYIVAAVDVREFYVA